jgi:2-polyprenyl-3-methyl-5-hydroxy-6-metoxy-1,4-benzoquinol methylase
MSNPDLHQKDGYGLTAEKYAEGYSLRQTCSTMTKNSIDWLNSNKSKWIPKCQNPKLLSIGCGDGKLDIPLLHALAERAPFNYWGVDLNESELSLFRNRLSEDLLLNDKSQIQFSSEKFDETSNLEKHFDLILMSHMLYYFQNPERVIKNAIHHLTDSGQLMIIQQSTQGIPQIRNELLSEWHIGKAPQPSEHIKSLLLNNGWCYQIYQLDAYLDVTCLRHEISPQAKLLMSFCIGEDLSCYPEKMTEQVKSIFLDQSEMKDGKKLIREPIDIMLISAVSNN